MPQWQLEKVFVEAFGDDWQSLFREFDKIPIAAASIGQVHKATILDPETQKEISVAVKIQYPGVAQSIQSDITNLKLLLNFGNFLPKGLFLENTLKVMKKELEWETDFLREAHWTSWFKENLIGTQRDKFFEKSLGIFDFEVPTVYNNLTTTRILTTDFKQGIPINEAIRYPQRIRDRLGTSILYLCLKELFLLKAMQTDPNWTNFLFDYRTQTLVLLDFGATREFNTEFVILYQELVQAAALQDRDRCRNLSIQLGFLTGDETQVMINIHIDSMIILGLPFRSETLYDFSKHVEITKNIKNNIPKMLQDRLCPPPDDSYSLHRKLSGAFLLCSKLGAKVPCQVLLKHFSPS